ncbi:MAG TPA: DegT/DnrJ/EryC1/StrS family aminotransferase [candidate division WOR-3 bacterium]|uniref:DegT/DnrJ/EryC1/StrS family aminotransferase n=1 Tax=candidate division WOR-3 bacterium TaxID=2052148 RepID=A0A9C9EMT9_UNCW3|nr:DegT/DnrJ/EryC1/StrS family aminotransferase [candidate division WOR-3 bacterium]
MEVPFMDLKRQYENIKEEIDDAIQQTIDSCAFVSGKMVQRFEENFARYCGLKYAVCVSNGTSALYAALKALDIGKGDGVVTVPFTFIATVEAIRMTGARPLFVDIDRESYNMSTTALNRYIEDSCSWDGVRKVLIDKKNNVLIRAIIPVHLYGQMCDMEPIMKIARKYNLCVLEDAAQAHGASYKNRKAGSIGDLGCFSFYPSKNLGAFGQGGAVVTNDDKLAGQVRMIIDHGQKARYQHIIEGWNFKMDGFQAAVLNVKLKYLDEWNEARRTKAGLYSVLLKEVPDVQLPSELSDRNHIYHQYVIHTDDREGLQGYLRDHGVGSSIHYPIPVYLQSAYEHLGYKKGDFPTAENCASGVLSLPMFPELTQEEIEYVCRKVKDWRNRKS